MTDPSRQSAHEMPHEPRLEEDRALLSAFREGRAETLMEIYRAYSQRVARFLYGGIPGDGGRPLRLATAFELENGVQEVFVRAFEPTSRASYDGLRPYEGYLIGIARNVLHERVRDREVPTAEPKVDPEPSGNGARVQESQLEDREVARLLSEFLATRDEEERKLYELRFDRGQSQDEAAASLGVTRIQVRRRERRLKVDLLTFMQTRGYLAGIESQGWGFGASKGGAR